MADNVTFQSATLATPAAGTKVSSDENVTSGQLQRVKLAYSADGDDTHIGADVNGLDVDVTRLPALPAGTNNIGDVDVLTLPAIPAGTNNIGDVDVLTVPAPLSTTGNGTAATALRVAIASDSGGPTNVTNAGTFAVQDSEKITDNAAFTDGTSKVLPAGFIYDEVAGTALTENDVAAARLNVNRAQVGIIEDGATRARYATVTAANALKTDGSGVTQPVSGTVTANAGTNLNTSALALDATLTNQQVADNAAFTDGTTKVAMAGFIFDDVAGTALTENDAAAARVSSTRAVIVNLEDATTRTQKLAINAGGAAEVQGDVAHDAAASGNPVLIGAQMETMADSAPGTRSSTDLDATKLATTDGALFVVPTGPQTITLHATGVQTGAQVHAAPGSGLSIYITSIDFSIGAATASSIKLLLNGGADIWGPHYLEAVNGRGFHVTFGTPLKATANTRVDVTTTGAATQTVDIQGFIAPG